MLEKNLEILKERYPESFQALSENTQKVNFNIIDAKNGDKTAEVQVGDSFILVHSKYDPKREAERIVEEINLNGVSSIIVLGFGLGYHVVNLFQKLKDKDIKIFVVATTPLLFKEALKYQDFTELFSSDNFYLLLSNKINSNELIAFIEDNVDMVFENIAVSFLPSLVKYAKEDYGIVMESLKYIYKILGANKYTVTNRGGEWESNLLQNLYLFLTKPGINVLHGTSQDKPAILVAAGPSLDKNIDLLKEVKGKALIIAADAVLKKLLKHDIVPDIVTVIDGYKHILKYFEGLDYNRLDDVVLVTSPQFYGHVIEEWPGPVVFSPGYGVGEEIIGWVEGFSDYKGRIPTGGSVAHLSFGLACILKADPIVFVGQDLALTGGVTHASGSDYRKSLKEQFKDTNRKYYKIKDINGEDVWTRDDFYLFLEWFNKFIKDLKDNGNQTEFIDATEGGARIEGTEIMTLKEVINLYCQENNNINKEVLNKINSYQVKWNKDIILEFKKVIEDVKEIEVLARRGLQLIDQILDNQFSEKIKEFNSQLTLINNQINKLGNNVMFFESQIYDIYKDIRFEVENNMEILNRLVTFYNKLIEGSNNSLEILNSHYKRLIDEGDK
jgi:hypothetical protein